MVKEYSGSRYTQHSTGVADGTQGFMDFFKGFVERTKDRDIRIIRTIEDGSYVFVQSGHVVSYSKATFYETELAVFDIFRIENGKIVEHWDNMEPIPPRSEWANTGKF